MNKLVLTSVLLFGSTLCGSSQSATQSAGSSPGVVFHITSPRHPLSPVYISGIFLDGKKLPVDTPVSLSDHWLKRLTVQVTNVSGKQITEGSVHLAFPQTGSGAHGDPMMAEELHLGRYPTYFLRRSDGTTGPQLTGPSLPVDSGPNLIFSLPNSDDLQDSISDKAGELTKVDFNLRTFFFSDGSMWNGGDGFFVHSTTANNWVAITPSAFFMGAPTEGNK